MGSKISNNLLYPFYKKQFDKDNTIFYGEKIKITEYIQIKITRTIILAVLEICSNYKQFFFKMITIVLLIYRGCEYNI